MGLQLRINQSENISIDFDEDICVHGENTIISEDIRPTGGVCHQGDELCPINDHQLETIFCDDLDRHGDDTRIHQRKRCSSLTREKPQASLMASSLAKIKPCHYLNYLDPKARLKSFKKAPVTEMSIIRPLAFHGFFWDGKCVAVRCIWCGRPARQYIGQLNLLLAHESDCTTMR